MGITQYVALNKMLAVLGGGKCLFQSQFLPQTGASFCPVLFFFFFLSLYGNDQMGFLHNSLTLRDQSDWFLAVKTICAPGINPLCHNALTFGSIAGFNLQILH